MYQVLIIEKQRQEITGEPQNLEEQAIRLIGRDIYEKLVKGYTEKQRGRDCKDLPSFIIQRLPVRMRYDNNYFSCACRAGLLDDKLKRRTRTDRQHLFGNYARHRQESSSETCSWYQCFQIFSLLFLVACHSWQFRKPRLLSHSVPCVHIFAEKLHLRI